MTLKKKEKPANGAANKRKEQAQPERREIVSELYSKGMSIRYICKEIERRLGYLPSTHTVFKDIQALLKEWKELRMSNIDALITEELMQIDATINELMQEWEKSKEDKEQKQTKRRGVPLEGDKKGGIKTQQIEEIKTDRLGAGDVRYIVEIRAQKERRDKLLGLYDQPEDQAVREVKFTITEHLLEKEKIETITAEDEK